MSKRFLFALVAVCLSSTFSFAQAGPTVGKNDAFAWSAVTTDAAGGPETVASYDVAIAAAGKDLNVAGTVAVVTVNVAAPKVDTISTTLLATLPNGNYVCQVRARDAAGNAGAFCAPFPFAFDGVAPAPPANLHKM